MRRLEPRPAEDPVGKSPALLHPRLSERIDRRQRREIDRRHLEEEEQLAEGEGRDAGQGERRARPPALGERQLRGALLGIQQRTERMAAEVSHTFEVLVRGGHVDRHAVVVDAEEDHDLVARSVDEELQLRVLVGGAEADRRLPPVDGAIAGLRALAEALGPELAEPVARRREALAVRHQHEHPLLPSRREEPERRGERERGVPERRRRRPSTLVHAGRTGEELLDVDSRRRGREEPDRRQHGEATVDALGNHQLLESLVVDDLPQRPLPRVGGDDEMALVVDGPERVHQPVADDHELRDRLRGFARLADDVEQSSPEIESPEQRAERVGVDGVGDHDTERAALDRERAGERADAERRPTDAEHDERIELSLHRRGHLEHASYGLPVVRQRRERQRTGRAPRGHVVAHAQELRLEGREILHGEPVAPRSRREQPVQVQPQGHRVAPAAAPVLRHRPPCSLRPEGGQGARSRARRHTLCSASVPIAKLAADVEALTARLAPLRAAGKRVVFTNGCFDLLHPGQAGDRHRCAADVIAAVAHRAVEVLAQARKSRGIEREGVVEVLGVQQPPQEPPLRLGRRRPLLRQ